MIIFGKFKFLLEMSGLDPQARSKNYIARIVYTISFLLSCLLASIFVAQTFSQDIDQSLPVVCIILADCALLATYSHLLINRDRFYSLLDDVQDIVDESV